MSKITLFGIALVALAAFLGCGTALEVSGPETELIQSRCTLTYAAGESILTFKVGQQAAYQGGVLADGECRGINQSIIGALPEGLDFTVDRSGRRWTMSGTPRSAPSDGVFAIRATAVYGTATERTAYKAVRVVVE